MAKKDRLKPWSSLGNLCAPVMFGAINFSLADKGVVNVKRCAMELWLFVGT